MSNARSKRLNENSKPVVNYGIADTFHKLVLPQNTTANLALISPNEIGSVAFDTTLGAVVVNDGTGFHAVSSATGPILHVLTSNASVGLVGEIAEALVVPGLLATDSVISVAQSVPGTDNTATITGWTSVAANLLTVTFTHNPGAGLVAVITVIR
jgi:hypothetical protein